MAEALVLALADLKEEEAIGIARRRLEVGEDPMDILVDCQKGMEVMGDRFASGEYFLPDLIYSGEILKQITEMVKPGLSGATERKKIGRFVLGTVAGDIHDIGKDIVGFMLDVNGFEVFDLGIDVPKEKFVEKIKEVSPQIVGLSGFLTLAFDSMKDTIKAIEDADLRNRVKVMIGGGQIDDAVKNYTGADAYRPDAVSAVALAKEWVGSD